jgi:hypothetical protein
MSIKITRLLAATLPLMVVASLCGLSASAEDMSLRPLGYSSSNTGAYTTTSSNTQSGYGATTTPSYSTTSYGGGYNAYNQTYGQAPLRGSVSTIPKGTTMVVKLDQPISSESSRIGEPITATIDTDVLGAAGNVLIPAGSSVQGQVTGVMNTRHMGRDGEVAVRFYEVRTPAGTTIPIHGHIATADNSGRLKGDSALMEVAEGVGVAAGGTAIGAVGGTAVGGILGVAGTGAAMGTGIGAIGGIGYALARKGKEVVIPGGTRISIKVDEDTSVAP